MRKIIVTVSFLLIWACSARAQETDDPVVKEHFFSLALETSQITYKEPGFMRDRGIMAGISGSYDYTGLSPWRFGADLKVNGGKLDYTSNGTGSMNGDKDYIVEVRGKAGYDIDWKKLVLTPYLGVGYRFLSDDSHNRQTTTGDWGYRRESNYFYLPLGVTASVKMPKGWTLTPCGEYDIFIRGAQFSRLQDVDENYNNLHNRQSRGYGLRCSFKVAKTINKKLSVAIEPFFRYWNIKQSRRTDLVYDNVIIGYGYEPKNISDEIGCKIGVEF